MRRQACQAYCLGKQQIQTFWRQAETCTPAAVALAVASAVACQAWSPAACNSHCLCCTDLFTLQLSPIALQNAGNMDKSSTALLGGMSKGKGALSGSSPLGPKPGQSKSAAGRPDADDNPATGGIAAFGGPAEASGSREVHFGFKCMPEFLKLMLACWV